MKDKKDYLEATKKMSYEHREAFCPLCEKRFMWLKEQNSNRNY